MGLWLYRMKIGHKEVFGSDEPHSYHFILLKAFDFWNIHPLRPELSSLYHFSGEENKKRFEKFVNREYPLTEGLEGVAPKEHFGILNHRSENMVVRLSKDKRIHVPCSVMECQNWSYVYEGHHRSGAAAFLGWKYIPAFVVVRDCVDKDTMSCMTDGERELMSIEQEKRGLPDSSRVHGIKHTSWTKEHREQFMFKPENSHQWRMKHIYLSKIGNEEQWGKGFWR